MWRNIWITGVSAVTPLGNGLATFGENVLAGRSGVAEHRLQGQDGPTGQYAAKIGEIPLPEGWDEAAFRKLNRLEQLSLSCTTHALCDAGLWSERRHMRLGLVLGFGAEYFRVWELDTLQGGNRICDPTQDTQSIAHYLKQELGIRGPASAVAAACASGGFAMALGRRWIQMGWLDACIVGGCDLVTPMSYAGFYNLRALSRRDDAPARASRPFDRDRDGFVMGEGGAAFLLESAQHARRRGAHAYAELAGCGVSSDATHMVIPSADGQGASRAMQLALADAAIAPDEVDYVNAHAAGTPVGDKAEAHAVRIAFGSAADRVPVSSTKSMTGHLLSGAASVETAVCLVALREQALPPTINLESPDPECALNHVPLQARKHRVRVTASNSFGFGGSNICIVLRQVA